MACVYPSKLNAPVSEFEVHKHLRQVQLNYCVLHDDYNACKKQQQKTRLNKASSPACLVTEVLVFRVWSSRIDSFHAYAYVFVSLMKHTIYDLFSSAKKVINFGEKKQNKMCWEISTPSLFVRRRQALVFI